jgi:hypothetical protein
MQISQLWHEGHYLDPKYQRCMGVLPNGRTLGESWGNWEPNGDDGEYEEVDQMLQNGEYEKLIMNAMYQRETARNIAEASAFRNIPLALPRRKINRSMKVQN